MSLLNPETMKLIREASDLEFEKKRLADRTTEINNRLDEISLMVHRDFSLDDDPEIIVPGIGRVLVTIEPRFNVLTANKPELIRRFKDNPDTAAMVKEEINARTLASYLKECLRETAILPHSDIINQFDQPVIKFKRER
jgi:hypothetical protein